MTVQEAILKALNEGVDPDWLEDLCLQILDQWREDHEPETEE